MQFTVDRDAFTGALGVVARATKANSPMTVLSGVLVRAGEGGLRLAATDLELTIQASVAAEVEGDGSVVLPAKHLLELVRRLPPGEVRVTVEDGTKAVVTAGRSRFTLHGAPARAFPALPKVEGSPVRLASGALADLLKRTTFAASTDESRPVLTGVSLQGDGESLRALATDTFRVAWAEKRGLSYGLPFSAVVPGRSLAEVGRLLKDDAEDVRVYVSTASATFQVGAFQVTTGVFDSPYPDVLGMLPNEYPRRARASREELVAALDRASLVAGYNPQSKWLVSLDLAEGRIVITAQDPNLGVAREEVAAHYEGEPLVVGFNARYLLDGLKVVEDEEVEIRLTDASGAAAVRGTQSTGFEYVVLPVLLRGHAVQDAGAEAEPAAAVVG